jgi:hypothetical protein
MMPNGTLANLSSEAVIWLLDPLSDGLAVPDEILPELVELQGEDWRFIRDWHHGPPDVAQTAEGGAIWPVTLRPSARHEA